MRYILIFAAILIFASSSFAGDDFIHVKGGAFLMGSPESENWRSDDELQHKVILSDFYISRYEVTQKEYKSLTGENPSSFQGDNRPVENVSWLDAIKFCNLKSEHENLTPVYEINGDRVTWNLSANGYRLPSASVIRRRFPECYRST